ncbi:MAG: 3-oxoacyl-ACP reductase FabG [Anaerolineae bacterium]|nr:3-oxoacyl-ACP reductase FabG [Anaerolineae bacterium]
MTGESHSLEGKVAVVTGAARGIGLEIAARLAEAGVRTALVDVISAAAQEAATQLLRERYAVLALTADVSSRTQVQAMVKTVMDAWGRVDILVNNAGICPLTPLDEITEEEWNRVLAVNLHGPFLCSQAVAPIMRQQRAGKIINIASSAGQMGGVAVGPHYSASKAGILGLTKSLARILAPDIQVNTVAPGPTESEMSRAFSAETTANLLRQIPLRRLGNPPDVAAAVLFLASAAADYITGQTLSVNGGLVMP